MNRSPRLARIVEQLSALFRSLARGRPSPESQVRVSFDDREIVCSYPDGVVRRAAWSELTEVRIRTTSEGPFLPDVFWGLHAGAEEPRIIVPQGASGDAELLHAMQRRLPGFDNLEVGRAMGSTDDRMFVVWRAPRAS